MPTDKKKQIVRFRGGQGSRRTQLREARLCRGSTPRGASSPPNVTASTSSASDRKLGLGTGLVGRHLDLASESDTDSTDRDDSASDDSSSVGDMNGQISTLLVRTVMLSDLVKGLPCADCHAETLAVRVVNQNLGLVCLMETYCTSCGHVLNSTLSSDRVSQSGSAPYPYAVTRHTVAAFMDMGVGHSGVVKLCRFLDMPSVHHRTFVRHAREVSAANLEVVNRVFEDAATVVRQAYHDADPSIGDTPVIDLTVSFDGSWMKRGHQSLYGIGCVIDVVTGLVIDTAVLSLYCQRCAYASTRYNGKEMAAFIEWYRTHSPSCVANYTGSSGGMEVKAAEIMWRRSLDRGFRYTTLVSDGDSQDIPSPV